MRKISSILLVAILLMGGEGCNRRQQPVAVHPVSGQVMYGGAPAAGVQVYFYPTSAPMVPTIPSNPTGITGPDGRFQLTTYTEGDGAAEGGYQVILLWPAEKKKNSTDADDDRLLGWYGAVHSKLTARVVAGQNNIPTFYLSKVSSPPEELNGIPGKN